MKTRKMISLALCLMMLLSVMVLFGCKQEGPGSDSTVELSYWIPVGEDTTYYMSYEENPAVKYLETLEYNGRKVDLSFMVPLVGSERDNFNTLLATDEYADILNMSFATSSPVEMLEDDIIYDLTPYVEEYMPNYMKIIENNPLMASYMYSIVDGEKRILSIYAFTEEVLGNFMGYLYRRDWVAKYGTHPTTGKPFTYSLTDPNDKESWTDDVVFPSGGADPVYISDWEWMFEIFEKAHADLGITDGYMTSLFFKGHSEVGGLNSSFGGGNSNWYLDPDGNAAFGGDNNSLRTYLECMNTWYKNGWLDKGFAERTSDQIFSIDSANIHAGKVGLWTGRRAETGAQMDNGDELTSGIMVYGARFPINDVYGTDAEKMKEPDSFHQYSQLRGSNVITKKVAEEDLPTILSFLDYLYTDEGGALMCFGLTKEQYEEVKDETYTKYNLTNGAYRVEQQADGSKKYIRDESLISDNNLASAMAAKRMAIGYYAKGFVPALNASYLPNARNAMAEWDYYINKGTPDRMIRLQFTPEESALFGKVYANVDTHMASNLPKFIKGSLDIKSDEDWQNYSKMLSKYSPEKVTAIYQRLFDLLSK